ncbi:MAG: hypothetical protein RMK20_09125 [Verrucomicrobiales bacterium]|nr:hypothetical protein [Verrucomicrobiales bacterium]
MNTTAHVPLVEGARFDENHARALMQPHRRSARLVSPDERSQTRTGSPGAEPRLAGETQNWDWLAWRLQHPVTLPSPLNDIA